MNGLTFGVLLICCRLIAGKKVNPEHKTLPHDPDSTRNVTQLISSKGYPVEDHTVLTEDGYVLSIQHIPHGKTNQQSNGRKQVVFLQHGLLCSASDYVINFPEQSLGFLLADEGYDVWLGNIRGNTYSRHHIRYTPHMKEFWDYSFDEMAEFDLPAMIDYVLQKTNQKQLFYIGHSQGTTSAFALLSESPEYNEKIKLFIALAPVVTVGEMTSPIRFLAPFTSELRMISKLIGANEFLPSNLLMKYFSELVCDTKIKFLCDEVLFLFFGADLQQLNQTRLGVYTSHMPAGSSAKSLVHFGQLINSKLFAKFDYGKKGNMERYNQTTPPEYDVSRITAPVALVWSLNDHLADPADVGLLSEKLKTLVSSYCVPFPLFNHGDFVLAMDAKPLVNDHVIWLLKNAE